jgi:hypothetical protein
VALLVVFPLLALGGAAVHASQSDAGPQIPPGLRSSLGTVVAASRVSETHPVYMPIVMKDGTAPACTRPVAGAAVGGASTGTINTQYVFTATLSPADATTPITYKWLPEPLSGQGTANATYQWDVAGSQTVNVQVTNCGGPADAAHAITINDVCERPLAGAAIDGASTGTINTQYAFVASPAPADATTPLTYSWSPEPLSGQGTANATYQWDVAGSQTVNVQVTNCGGPADAAHAITINDVCERPLTGAAIDGASTGTINTQYAFAASPAPADATTPLTYSWSPDPLSGQGTANATYQWDVAGSQTINVQVTNCGGSVSTAHTIDLRAPTSGIPVASVLTPFDANESDLYGPGYWRNRYGKSPEIVVASNGVELDVLAQDYDAGTTWDAVLLHIEPNQTGYEITQALTDIPFLDRVMGLASDAAGNRYYATGVDEDDRVDSTYPPLNTYRNDIVRILKLDKVGKILFNIDVDIARHAFDNSAEMMINPMVASTSRLAVGADEIALVHGINTDPDWNIGGSRHQKALSTRLSASSGEILRTSSIWVSHSFDQRLLFDGAGIIEHHLGDAYPRMLVYGRDHTSHPLLHIKGALGDNDTYTRLGNIAVIEEDPGYGTIALFATESNAATGQPVNGPRNLAIVRIKKNDNSIDPALPDTLTVESSGVQQTNRLRWLTQYSAASNTHAERPKLIGIGNDQYVVLWEEWLATPDVSGAFNGVHAMLIDDKGNVLQAAKLITKAHHLHRGDDAFFLDGRAAWMTGNGSEKKLYIHFVDSTLNYTLVTLD